MSDLTFANRDITNFRQRLNKGGVRSNLFEVEIKDIQAEAKMFKMKLDF